MSNILWKLAAKAGTKKPQGRISKDVIAQLQSTVAESLTAAQQPQGAIKCEVTSISAGLTFNVKVNGTVQPFPYTLDIKSGFDMDQILNDVRHSIEDFLSNIPAAPQPSGSSAGTTPKPTGQAAAPVALNKLRDAAAKMGWGTRLSLETISDEAILNKLSQTDPTAILESNEDESVLDSLTPNDILSRIEAI